MDFESSKFEINNKICYYFSSKKTSEKYNLYDLEINFSGTHIVFEEGWDDLFEKKIVQNIQIISIGSIDNIVDLEPIFKRIPKAKYVFIECKGIVNESLFKDLIELEYLSISCSKNQKLIINLPVNLKYLLLDWKRDYVIHNFPKNLKYINLSNYQNTFNIINESKSLIKLVLSNCKINDLNISNLTNLHYLEIFNSELLDVKVINNTNTSLKYVYLNKIKTANLNWIQYLVGAEVLILENCGNIDNINFLDSLTELKGLVISGNTSISDGNLRVIEKLVNLKNLFIKPMKHYTHKSLNPWSWLNFDSENVVTYIKV